MEKQSSKCHLVHSNKCRSTKERRDANHVHFFNTRQTLQFPSLKLKEITVELPSTSRQRCSNQMSPLQSASCSQLAVSHDPLFKLYKHVHNSNAIRNSCANRNKDAHIVVLQQSAFCMHLPCWVFSNSYHLHWSLNCLQGFLYKG